MKISFVSSSFAIAGCLAVAAGCQDATNYRTDKPVLDSDPAEQVEEASEEAGEALSDAADAVTPDESIVDIKTPLGDVKVGRDPATGGTNVDVDSDRASIDVDTDE